MKTFDQLSGIALICDEMGYILKILRDDIGLSEHNPQGKLISSFIDPLLKTRALDFIMEIKSKNLVVDYPLSLSFDGKTFDYNFSGAFLEGRIWLIGAGSTSETLEFLNHLQQINNEQANYIRQLFKSKLSDLISQPSPDDKLYLEFSKLNNELINLQRELSKKNTELERLNKLKNQFLGMAAHDLRNPLSVIMGYADFLKEETQDQLSDEHQQFLDVIYSSARFMLHMIDDLLEISRIESGKLNLLPFDGNLIELASRNIELNNTLAARKNIRIELKASDDSIIMEYDTNKMEQVLNNLLGNAIKFTNPGGRILVIIENFSREVVMKVQDFGVGIAPENLEEVFTPFGKATSRGTGGEKSTGLGLSIVRKIVEGHGGSINVESEPGKGATFTMIFPKKMPDRL